MKSSRGCHPYLMGFSQIFTSGRYPIKIYHAVYICEKKMFFVGFFQLLYLKSGFLSVAYLTVADLSRLGISVHCQASVRFQYLVRLLSYCWITGGHTIYPPVEELLPRTGIEPTPFRNQASKVAGLQVYPTTPGIKYHKLDLVKK